MPAPLIPRRVFLGQAALALSCGGSAPPPRSPAPPAPPAGWVVHQAPSASPTAAYRWLDIVLEASARSADRFGARPTILSREMAIAVTAMYDAWAAFDDRAVGTRLGGALRAPPAQRTLANRERAIATAVRAALVDLHPEDAAWIDAQLRDQGGDPANDSTDASTPEGVGNTVASALLAYRRRDGANQRGDEPGSNGAPYADDTAYEPTNPPDRIVDPDRWQPIPFDDGKGGVVYPGFLTPHWFKVKPFALGNSAELRPPPYPKVGSEALRRELEEILAYSGQLTLERKAIVELMRDGPRSTGQSGHWLRFAEDVARRDRHALDRDVKLFFCVANVVFDAFIACWEAKRHYDSARPWTLIRHLYAGRQFVAWAGPCKGTATIAAEQWRPYSPATFVTPPFPGYPSGHSTASGAAAKILELFTGSDRFGSIARRRAGELTEPGCGALDMQAFEGNRAIAPPSPDVVLELPTFTATAEMAGISRVMGGYHIQADNLAGLRLGRELAARCWPVYQAYFEGTAAVRAD